MIGKELAARFKAATFGSVDDVGAFVRDVIDPAPADVSRVLDTLSSRAPDQRLRLQAFAGLARGCIDKALFPTYLKAARTADPELRGVLFELLPAVNNVAEHAALVGLLRSPDAATRDSVARVLPVVGGRSAFEMVAALVSEPGFAGRGEALDALMAMAPQHAVPALAATLSAGSTAEKLKALRLIVEPGCTARNAAAVVEAIVAALSDPAEPVVIAALTALASVATEAEYLARAAPALDSRHMAIARAAIEGVSRFPSARAVGALRRKLQSGPNALRLAAIAAMERIGTSDVLGPLVDALGHSQITVRQSAGEALSRLSLAGRIDLARTVVWLLRSRDVNVRRMAGELVQTVKDPDGELWPMLLGHLRDEDWWVRERIMDALAEMAGADLVRHLAGFLNDPVVVIRRFAVDGLLRLKSPASLGLLVRTAANDPDWWVRERAIEAVGALKDTRAVPHLLELMRSSPQDRLVSLNALAEIGSRTAAPAAAEALASDDPDVQIAALHCLSRIGDADQGDAVQPLVRDARTEVRLLARDLLKRWGDAEPLEALVEPVPVLDQMLKAVARGGGDDLILAAGRRPLAKVMGRTRPLGQKVYAAENVRALLLPHLSAQQVADLESAREVDFSYRLESEDLRFRANVFQQLGGLTAVFRIIRATVPDPEALGLPPVVRGLAALSSGLVLVGGATGSGKSTTLAAIINHINSTSRRHIVTLEDPIEVVHARRLSIVNQRELGTHTGPLAGALRSTLRQDPDVVLVGELRDAETMSFAVTAAETGHLVFGTIHTVSAAGSIDRVVNAFPAGQHEHIRSIVAGSLRAVVCQHLLARKDAPGRVLAVEVLLNTDAVASLIRSGKTFQLPSAIATAREQGMQLMDVELLRLCREGKVHVHEAHAKAVSKKDFEALLAAEVDARRRGPGAIGDTPATEA